MGGGLDCCVAEATVDAEAGRVVIVRKRNGLVVGRALGRCITGTSQQEQDQENAAASHAAKGDARLRQTIGLLRKELGHAEWRDSKWRAGIYSSSTNGIRTPFAFHPQKIRAFASQEK